MPQYVSSEFLLATGILWKLIHSKFLHHLIFLHMLALPICSQLQHISAAHIWWIQKASGLDDATCVLFDHGVVQGGIRLSSVFASSVDLPKRPHDRMHNYCRTRSFLQKPSAYQGMGFQRQLLRSQKELGNKLETLIEGSRNLASWTDPDVILFNIIVDSFFTNSRPPALIC